MKKIIVVLLSVLIIGANSVYAINIEKIPYDDSLRISVDDKAFDTTDASKLMYNTQPIYGNGIYLQYDNSWGVYPEKYKPSGLSNSPLYIYDKDLNLINTVEFNDYLIISNYINGFFYGTQTMYGDGEVISYKRVKSEDGITFAEISEKEFTYSTNEVTLYNGERYTWEKYIYEQDGIKYVSLSVMEYLINSNGEIELIKREGEKNINLTKVVSAKDINIHILSRMDEKYFTERYDKEYKYISIDGLSMIQLPEDAYLYDIWNDDNCVYVGIEDDEVNCYKINISDIANFIKVKYNNTYLSFATPPTTENDRTLVPMRFLFEQMGAEVEWEEETQTAVVTKGEDVISFSIDNNNASVNGEIKSMDVPARLINDKTMIPVRFLSEELGCTVKWDEEANTVIITD